MLKGFLMSIGMFSVFPTPKNAWEDRSMHLMMVFLPIVGGMIGFVWYAATLALLRISAPILMVSAISVILPFALSGFLHLDGFMDTNDAIMSRRSLEERRRILKDSHLGAFAAVSLLSLFILQFSAVYTVVGVQNLLPLFIYIPIVSRCVTGVAMLKLKPIFETGYAVSFKSNTKLRHLMAITFIGTAAAVIAYIQGGLSLLVPILATIFAAIIAAGYSYRQLRGFSGDLCGYVISISEAAGLVWAAVFYGVG